MNWSDSIQFYSRIFPNKQNKPDANKNFPCFQHKFLIAARKTYISGWNKSRKAIKWMILWGNLISLHVVFPFSSFLLVLIKNLDSGFPIK